MDRVRVGVIGAGSWAVANHIPILASRQDVELVVVNRLGREKLQWIKEKYGFQKATEDYQEALAEGLDAVVIASPAAYHHEHAKAALLAGCNVLCEKPFTLKARDAWDLVETARSTGKHLLIAFGWNYKPMVRRAKQLMEQYSIGRIEHVAIHMASATRELLQGTGAYFAAAQEVPPERDTWIRPELSGGGYAPAQLSHALGLALWLSGLRADEVFAFMANAGAPVDLHDAVAIRYMDGAVGTLSGSSTRTGGRANKHQLEVRIYGSDGFLVMDLERERLWLFRGVDEDIEEPLEPNAGLYDCEGPPNILIDLTLGKNVENNSPGDLGARTVEIIEAAYRSVYQRRPVPISELLA
jgi:predicted dehydrogenase